MVLQGCAIVEFESAEQAAEAINTLHLSEVRSTVLFAIDALPICPVVCPSCAVACRLTSSCFAVQVDGREIYVRCAEVPVNVMHLRMHLSPCHALVLSPACVVA